MLFITLSVFASNESLVSTIEKTDSLKHNIKVMARENGTITVFYNNRHFDLEGHSLDLFKDILDVHLELFNESANMDIDYYRDTAMMNSSDNKRIQFSFYFGGGNSGVILSFVNFTDSTERERIMLGVEQINELKSALDKAVNRSEEISDQIQTLNEIVYKAKELY